MMGLDVLKTEAEYKKGGVMKYHYLIDYENVREKGLEGVFWLSPEDSILHPSGQAVAGYAACELSWVSNWKRDG